MTAPRHLWSGDWRRESAEAADELARRQALAEDRPAVRPPTPPKPSTPSPWARFVAHVRRLSVPAVVATALGVLLAAGAGYAAVSLVNGGEGRPSEAAAWLGVHTINSPSGNGVTVMEVAPDSPADRAGLHSGDVIIQIGNQPIQAPADVGTALSGLHAGEQVEIEYDRGPILHTTQATLQGDGP